ncbi:unnamed protein product, partial [marine sediment metagenome]
GREDRGAKRSNLVQNAIVWATGSRRLMTVADKLARMNRKPAGAANETQDVRGD